MSSNSLNIELNRRKTFHSWPSNAPVDPDNLARNGFHATENYLETQCYFCHRIISDWQYNDLVHIRHNRLNPNCPIFVNPNGCNNISIATTTENLAAAEQVEHSEGPKVDLKNEMNRLATFKNWPNPCISPQALAKAGFYYFNQDDQVKCAWCKGIIAQWERFDNAFEEHQRFFPDCPRVQLGPLIEIASDGIRDLGIQQICAPKKPKFSCLDARLRTYNLWPIPEIQNPEVLSAAGFYYQDIDDQVRCFHCNGGLRSWQKEDDPWFEHAKWFPQCQFLKLVKGPTFVVHVQETERQSSTHGTYPRENVSTLDEAMTTEPVQRALEMGLNEGRILNATRRQIENCGKPYETTEELVEAVLDSQVDEEDDEGLEQSSSIVREVSQIINNIFNPRNGSASANGVGSIDDDDDTHQEQFDEFITFPNLEQQNSSRNAPTIRGTNSNSERLQQIHETDQTMSINPSNEFIAQQNNPNIISSEALVGRIRNNIYHGRVDNTADDEADFDEIPTQDDNYVRFRNSEQSSSDSEVVAAGVASTSSQHHLQQQQQQQISQNIQPMPTCTINSKNPILRNNNSSPNISCIKSVPITGSASSTSLASCSSNSKGEMVKQISLEEENRKLKEARQCKVCMDDEVGVVFLPCGHLVTCVQCAPGVVNCPLCRTPIKGFVRTFLS